MARNDYVSDVNQDRDWLCGESPLKAPEGQQFIVIGRVDPKHYKGNAWQGLHNMKQGEDWHVQQPAIICDMLPDGPGWIYKIRRKPKDASDSKNADTGETPEV